MKEWIGVDLDGTIATYTDLVEITTIGEPIPLMVNRVKQWLKEGKLVKIFTARVVGGNCAMHGEPYKVEDVIAAIEAWCEKHIGQKLPVVNQKDFYMVQLWDDRAIQIIPNTGVRADGED